MLFWPGVPGQFMGMLPVTLIFVLSAALVVTLVYLPVLGGVTGRVSHAFHHASTRLRPLPWLVRAALVPVAMLIVFTGAMLTLNPGYLSGNAAPVTGLGAALPGMVLFIFGAMALAITMGAAKVTRTPNRIKSGYRRTPFGHLIAFLTGNPIMPLVTIAAVLGFVTWTFGYFGKHNNGIEFFVESEPEQAIVYVRARGNLSLNEKDRLVAQVGGIVLAHPGIDTAFAFAGEGGLNSNTGSATAPRDTIGQVQFETIPWEDRANRPELDGDLVISELEAQLSLIPGIQTEILAQARGPASGKPVHLRLKADDWNALRDAAAIVRAKFDTTPGLTQVEDTRPLPGIDWQIDVDTRAAGRYGADVMAVGGMVQLVTRGILLDTMPVDSSDEEIEIRARLPEKDRVLSTLDTLKVRTDQGLVPLSNFTTRQPVPKLAQIDRVDQQRYFDVKAGVAADMVVLTNGDGVVTAMSQAGYDKDDMAQSLVAAGDLTLQVLNANERIASLTDWLDTSPLPAGVAWEGTGDQEEQSESGAFLQTAFSGALMLMFIILLAQFNSVYNAVLVLLAVVLSVAGVLIGMLVMDQAFSIIMTGTGIVALTGIVVNNNIILIDTYQEYAAYMPRQTAIVRTAEDRIRPVLLTTITTMAGLAPMMFGLSLDFMQGGYTINSPTALWWKQLATAVVFGLGIATVLTLVFTPAMLALRVWLSIYIAIAGRGIAALTNGRSGRAAQDWALARSAARITSPELIWLDDEPKARPATVRAAE